MSDYILLNLCVCYLPPANSTRPVDAGEFFSDLLKNIYELYPNNGDIVICCDFKTRCGDESDYVEGVAPVLPCLGCLTLLS